MGKPRKNFSIKEFLSKNKADLIMLQEAKKQPINKTCSSSLWKGKNKDWVFSPTDATARGMLIAWRTDTFEVKAVEYGTY